VNEDLSENAQHDIAQQARKNKIGTNKQITQDFPNRFLTAHVNKSGGETVL
jgi:hypothetical protein